MLFFLPINRLADVDVVVSDSKGDISIVRVHSNGPPTTTHTWHAHDLETWIAAYSGWNDAVVYSGNHDDNRNNSRDGAILIIVKIR